MPLFKINHISSFQIFQLLKYGGQILINVLLAKTAMATSELGKFEYFLFVASSVSFFWVTGIMQALLALFNRKESNKNTLFYSSTLLIFLFSIVSFLVALLIIKPSTDSISVYQKNILLIYLLINPISFLVEHILLLNNQYRSLIAFGVISFITPPLIISAPVFYDLNITFSFYALIIWTTIKLIYVIYLLKKYNQFNINIKQINKLFYNALPLIGTSLVAGSAAYIDGFIVKNYYDSETFAIFRYGAKEFPLFLIAASAFSNSMIPEVAKEGNFTHALRQIKESSGKMIFRFFPIAIIMLFSSQYLFPFVFNNDFLESYKVFDIYLLLILSRFIFAQTILIGLKKQKIVFFVSIGELMVNVAASLIFVQYFGYLGVAYGTVVAYLFEKGILIVIIKREFKVNLEKYLPNKKLFLFVIITASLFFVKEAFM